ncbi:MAG: four helix bundle protein [Deltaproteobacteria bacterium]|nr:four helix bundle protein [Deltaproteobacteria bacterium]
MFTSFKDMPVWQHSIAIAEEIHTLTENLPRKEDYGLTSQIRRSALSISANIAEGYGRQHTLDKINFYFNARGSLTETQSHLEYAARVSYISTDDLARLDTLLSRLYHEINKIIGSLRASK